MASKVKWTAIVLTCQNKDRAHAYQKELELRQQRGLIEEGVLLLTVEDPKGHVGSGGATLNALLVVAEHISAQQGYTVVNSDVLAHSYILIMHMGRNFPFDPCGRAFMPIPVTCSDTPGGATMLSNIDILLQLVTGKVAIGAPPGVWICSTDMLLDIPSSTEPFNYEGVDVCAVSVPASVDYAQHHGVYKVGKDGCLEDIVFQGTEEAVQAYANQHGCIPLVGGLVFLAARIAEKLLSLHVMPPLDACTYMGLDSGATPIQLSLFFDILLSMCSAVSQRDFVSGTRSGPYGRQWSHDTQTKGDTQAAQQARQHIWRELHSVSATVWCIAEGRHLYLECQGTDLVRCLSTYPRANTPSSFQRQSNLHSVTRDSDAAGECTLVNSVVDAGAVVGSNSFILHSHLGNRLRIGQRCLVTGLKQQDITVAGAEVVDNTVLEAMHIRLPTSGWQAPLRVLVTFGLQDKLQSLFLKGKESTFCDASWDVFFMRTGIQPEDLWDTDQEDKCLLTARLYPVLSTTEPVGLTDVLWLMGSPSSSPGQATGVFSRWRSSWRMSLQEILTLVDVDAEFAARREMSLQVSKCMVRRTLLGMQDQGLNSLYAMAVVDGFGADMLQTLDDVACECSSPGIAARTLANVAGVLGAMSRGRGGLRSGPAGNEQWAKAFQLLEAEDICGGVRALSAVRNQWLDRPDRLVRAARHYEGAAQILIRHAVMTARQFIHTSPDTQMPELNTWVTVECPARVDIAGGWSDTPPITYEHGGAVINAAITVDGQKPIGAKVRRIARPELVLHIGAEESTGTTLTLSELEQLADYSQPQAPGALLKAAFLCAEVVRLPCDTSLRDQLTRAYDGGFELHTWSNLPHGSGLGTSSILAGAVMAALWKASGKLFDIDSLNHAVLHLEQMLTTGGGWQDQVGGLTPGIKVGHSKAALPLRVHMHTPDIAPACVQAFSDRLLLVYTGKTRLARNLLQNVVRNWYARDPEIVKTEHSLVSTAWECTRAFEQGDLASVGECMNTYWEQKKRMAPGCEPKMIADMMHALRPHVHGLSLAGAGGGGFMYVLTKEPNSTQTVAQVLATVKGTEGISIHQAAIDLTGMTLTVPGQGDAPLLVQM